MTNFFSNDSEYKLFKIILLVKAGYKNVLQKMLVGPEYKLDLKSKENIKLFLVTNNNINHKSVNKNVTHT